MIFEWDPVKNDANKVKHGIDFNTAQELWHDENRIEIRTPHPVENRYIIIGRLKNKHWTAVYAPRGDTIRIISVRRSREKEAALYDKEKAG